MLLIGFLMSRFVLLCYHREIWKIEPQALGCDLFVCSAYKFCGPHAGILWGKQEVLQKLVILQLNAKDANEMKVFSGTF